MENQQQGDERNAKEELITIIRSLIKTAEHKDFTSLEDWIEEGDIDNMSPAEIAREWDELPDMETD